MTKLELYLTKAQHKRCTCGEGFKLTHEQLVHNPKATHRGKIEINKKIVMQLVKALNSGKGHTFRKGSVSGTGIWDNIKHAGHSILEAGRKGLSFIKENAGLNNMGDVIEKIKELVPEDYIKAGLDSAAVAGSSFIGNPELGAMAIPVIHKALNVAYNHDYRKPFHEQDTGDKIKTEVLMHPTIGKYAAKLNDFNRKISSIMPKTRTQQNYIDVDMSDQLINGEGLRRKMTKPFASKISQRAQQPIVRAGRSIMPLGYGYNHPHGGSLSTKHCVHCKCCCGGSFLALGR